MRFFCVIILLAAVTHVSATQLLATPTSGQCCRDPHAPVLGFITAPTVTLNEVFANPAPAESEWIELYNNAPEVLDLSGWQLDDEAAGSQPLVLPTDTLIEPSTWLLIEVQGSMFNNTGDQVRLLDPSGALVDSFTYTQTIKGRAWARTPDGLGAWQADQLPSPGAANSTADNPTPTAAPATPTLAATTVASTTPVPFSPTPSPEPDFTLVLNEFLADPETNAAEWIEVYNLGPDPALLEGWQLDDIQGGSSPVQLPAIELPAAQWYSIQLPTALLNNSGDEVRLLDPTGTVRDSISYTHSIKGLSHGRLPDGTGQWTAHMPPSPGAANQAVAEPTPTSTTSPTAFVSASATPVPLGNSNVVLNEFLADPETNAAEWIEVYNHGPDPALLEGWQLDDGPGGGSPVQLPAIELPAAQWYSIELPAALLNNSGDEVRLLDPSGTVIDSTSYTHATKGRSHGRLPDGTGQWTGPMPPSPGAANQAPVIPSATPTSTPKPTSTSRPTSTPKPTKTPKPTNTPKPTKTPKPTSVPKPTTRIKPTHTAPSEKEAAPPSGATSLVLNEFLAAPDSGNPEWVELYNVGSEPVHLAGWQIDDGEAGGKPIKLPAATIQPQQWYQFELSSTLLNNSGDQVRLLAPDGRVIDQATYPSTTKNRSYSRMPDGNGGWQADTAASPGAANQTAKQEPVSGTLLSIAQARELETDSSVTISATVTVAPHVLRAHVLYVQDASGGIMVQLAEAAWPQLEPGQQVQIHGVRDTYHGEPRLKVASIEHLSLLKIGPLITPQFRSGGELSQQHGSLVSVSGYYTRDFQLVTDDGSVIRMSLPKNEQQPRYAPGDRIQAQGIVGSYDGRIRLQLRGLGDLGYAVRLPDTSVTQPWSTMWLSGISLLCGGWLLRRRARRLCT